LGSGFNEFRTCYTGDTFENDGKLVRTSGNPQEEAENKQYFRGMV